MAMGKWARSWLPHPGKGTSSAQPKLHMDECQAEDPRQSPEDRAFLPSSLPLVTYLLMFPNPVESLMTPCSEQSRTSLSSGTMEGGVPKECQPHVRSGGCWTLFCSLLFPVGYLRVPQNSHVGMFVVNLLISFFCLSSSLSQGFLGQLLKGLC